MPDSKIQKRIKLFPHQESAVNELRTGSILCGGVGSGKSLTALEYYYRKYKGTLKLYIITTAKKRDSLEWAKECSNFPDFEVIVDSWNNIRKYTKANNSFFIFDEQRVIGSGSWVRSFLKIVKNNDWILLSATPGDSWLDYIPVFIANGFYKNRTEFLRSHVVYNNFTKFPKVDHFVEEKKLFRLRNLILVQMNFERSTKSHYEILISPFNKEKFNAVLNRWNPFKNKPIKDVSEYCYTMRKVVNTDEHRLGYILALLKKHNKLIVFYNFDYELEILRRLKDLTNANVAEYNGHKHETIPNSEKWVYLVQYTSGSEGWNCIETNAIVFYSQNYSYRITTQARGRIDRLNTPFINLYYYTISSDSSIDQAITKALREKRDFNEKDFEKRV